MSQGGEDFDKQRDVGCFRYSKGLGGVGRGVIFRWLGFYEVLVEVSCRVERGRVGLGFREVFRLGSVRFGGQVGGGEFVVREISSGIVVIV